MSHVLPQISLHRIILEGIAILKQAPDVLDDIFQYYTCPEMDNDYGQAYIDNIKKWFVETKIPVVQAWSINPQHVPQIAVRLASESEDETKSALGDHWGLGEDSNVGTAPFVVQLDVQIQASKNSDETLWLYYIICYILLKRKRRAEALGLQLHTWSATDYSRENAKLPDNVFARYLRVRTIVQNFWDSEPFIDINDIDVDLEAETVDGSQKIDL